MNTDTMKEIIKSNMSAETKIACMNSFMNTKAEPKKTTETSNWRARADELKASGMKPKDMLTVLNEEGYKNQRGKKITESTLKNYLYTYAK